MLRKLAGMIKVYLHLIRHVAVMDSSLLHVQWPYKFAFFDRTLLNLYYKFLGKRIVFTAHNVDAGARDGKQSWANRFSLRALYRLVDHIIVHTHRMKAQLAQDFGVAPDKVSVIPHGVMSAVPDSGLDREEARRRLSLSNSSRVILFFGLITPYKGVDLLVEAMGKIAAADPEAVLLIAGKIKECPEYWQKVVAAMDRLGLRDRIVTHLRHIPDEEVEIYLKAADVLVLPYRSIFQSGVLFLAYRFGLPVVATDVGSFREELDAAGAGFVCRVDDPDDMAATLRRYFDSPLYLNLVVTRGRIREYAERHYSWATIGAATAEVYSRVLNARR